MKISAPAKINLNLRVIGKRGDGFHEIDTLMVRLPALADELEIGGTDSGFSFACSDASVPADESNLVVKAIRAFERATDDSFRRPVFLRKNIPHGAGLGGGSSDAAAMLKVLAEHSGKSSPEMLREIAASLGSDIPFFLMDGAVRCTGRGEILKLAGNAPVFPILLLKPAFGVATPDGYKRWRGASEIAGVSYAPQEISGLPMFNDLERPVFEKHRVLAEMKHWLLGREDVCAALMCGSGSTMFAVPAAGADVPEIITAARAAFGPELWAWSGETG